MGKVFLSNSTSFSVIQEIAELDVDEIMAKQVEQLEKEKKELQERLKGQEKKVCFCLSAHIRCNNLHLRVWFILYCT